MRTVDVLVIGGGAAGLSAALVLARARRTVLVVDSGAPRNAPATHLHGFLSQDGRPPRELLAVGRGEVEGYGATIVDAAVEELLPTDTGLRARLSDGRLVEARRVLVATGLRDQLPDVPGLRDRWARDVLHCPYCHGWEVRDRPFGVLGGRPEAVRYTQIVRQWSDDVVLVMRPGLLTAADTAGLTARGVVIVEGEVSRVVVEGDRLRGVELDDGRVVEREVLFVPPRLVPNDRLLVGVGCRVGDTGWVTADPDGRTSVPGVWVAGNVVDPRAQLVTAAGEGSVAAIALNADLVEEDVSTAVRTVDGGAASRAVPAPDPDAASSRRTTSP